MSFFSDIALASILGLIIYMLIWMPYVLLKGIYETYLIKTGKSKRQREVSKSWREFDEKQLRQDTVRKIKKEKRLAEAEILIKKNKFEEAINIYDNYGYNEMLKETLRKQAYVREKALDYDSAILIWEELGNIKELPTLFFSRFHRHLGMALIQI